MFTCYDELEGDPCGSAVEFHAHVESAVAHTGRVYRQFARGMIPVVFHIDPIQRVAAVDHHRNR